MSNPIFLTLMKENTKSSLLPILREVWPNCPVKSFKSLEKTVQECLESEVKIGTLFIEFGFPMENISKVFSILRSHPEVQPEQTILIAEEDELNENELTKFLTLGFSGVMSKPFSEGSVQEVCNVSKRLSVQGSIGRLKVVTGLEIKSMLEQRGDKFEEDNILAAVKKACETFESENPGKKVADIAKEYSKLDPTDRLNKSFKDFYQGPSERVKKMLKEKKLKKGKDENK